jgi:hypothetical protein
VAHEAIGRPAVLRPRAGIVARDIAGETILVPVRGRTADMQRIFSLNPTAAFIWRLLDGVRDTSQILDAVVERFAVGREEAASDLERILAEARDQDLVDVVG